MNITPDIFLIAEIYHNQRADLMNLIEQGPLSSFPGAGRELTVRNDITNLVGNRCLLV